MAEYIEREKAWRKVNRAKNIEEALNIIDSLPTADVVPVVKCKDCKYYEIHKPSVTLNCERDGRLIPMMPDDYCSYGKKRTD